MSVAEPIRKESNADYHADRSRLSNSNLTLLANSVEMFDAIVNKGTMEFVQTDAMRFGHYVHCLVLEPNEFDNRYAIAPEGIDRRTTIGKATWANFLAESDGKEVLKKEDFLRAVKCANKILRNETVKSHLAGIYSKPSVLVEHRIDFECFGLPMRCKPDWLNPDLGLIIDVKTSRCFKRADFEHTWQSLGYHRQAWLYLEAARQQYGKDFRFWFAVVKTTEPHETACFEVDQKGLEEAGKEVQALVREYQIRTETNNWLADVSQGKAPQYITTKPYRRLPESELLAMYDESENPNE